MRLTLAWVLVAATGWSVAACEASEHSAAPPSAPRTGALSTTSTESCARPYDRQGLRAQAFAVDATVDSFRRHGQRVELHVTEWFRGGSGETLSIAGLGDPDAPGRDPSSEWGQPYDVGTRLLISGQYADDGSLLVWHCGYTRYWSRDDLATWRDTFGSSATPLPDDRTTVPYVPYGASDAEVVRLVEAAGLVAVVPDVDWPHYVTGVDPPAGTVVPLGSEVELRIGDG